MSKSIELIGNVIKRSNKIIVDSNTNLDGLKEKSLIRVGNSNYFYTIKKANEIRIIKDFTKIDDFNIKINDDQNIFVKGDLLDLSYKEYELNTINNVLTENIFFTKGETLNIEGGNLTVDVNDNSTQAALLKYTINKNFSILNRGRYIQFPENPCKITSNSGMFILANLSFKELDNRKINEKSITEISRSGNETIISLDSSLFSGVTNGKISTRKFEIILTETYDEPSENSVQMTISRDFSPNLGLAMVSPNSKSHDLLQNRNFALIDEKFKDLEIQINELKDQITALSNKIN